ncbi:MAG: electron transfer flavoprotein subunit alpha/FixB family protein [Nitrososphaerota archaeon]|nr:electron transfer flavoprotein subunit alpha/FixB family protein [Candidatus Calditenuaceae archaeon]MDW8072982.1 electron transfer flavoprotein subunit alpha/FixB family protein [Nitrososphaerota archaeon]
MKRSLIVAGELEDVLGLRGVLDSVGLEYAEAFVPDRLLGERAVETLGLKKIYAVERFDEAQSEALAGALRDLVTGADTLLVLAPSRKMYRELFARVGQSLASACVNDCTNISLEEGKLVVERPTLGGGYVESLEVKRFPAFLTFQPMGRSPRRRDATSIEVVKLGAVTSGRRTPKLLSVEVAERGGAELSRAKVVVSVGRGFKKREDLRLAEELARLLGAELACSRPISSDLGWMPEDRHVGLSGRWISPQLYIAIGISGQVQHTIGVRGSKIIVAVNSDPSAPIHREADYSVTHDLYQFIPALIKALRERSPSRG